MERWPWMACFFLVPFCMPGQRPASDNRIAGPAGRSAPLITGRSSVRFRRNARVLYFFDGSDTLKKIEPWTVKGPEADPAEGSYPRGADAAPPFDARRIRWPSRRKGHHRGTHDVRGLTRRKLRSPGKIVPLMRATESRPASTLMNHGLANARSPWPVRGVGVMDSTPPPVGGGPGSSPVASAGESAKKWCPRIPFSRCWHNGQCLSLPS